MSRLPDREAILQWVRDNPNQSSKRDIARAFGIKGADRIELKRILRDLHAEGLLTKERRSYRDRNRLAPVEVLRVTAIDKDGDLFAEPENWKGDEPPPPVLYVAKKGDPALAVGDRILCRIAEVGETHVPYEGRLIRRIGAGPTRVVGIFRQDESGGRILPVDRKSNLEWAVMPGERGGARDGELVEAEQIGGRGRIGLSKARIMARLGDPSAPKALSLIAIHQHGIPDRFPDEALAEAASAAPVSPGGREDLRDLPFVTIDPADARDRDDAVCALPDDDVKNPGGHVVWVAIADVAHHVPPGSALDREARRRGNSTYFPDRVVPMLPDALSADACSLNGDVDRPCVALRVTADRHGRKLAHRFTRALIRSRAALSYRQAQSAADGSRDEVTASLPDGAIGNLWKAYGALREARDRRQPLHLDLPERRIVLSEDGKVAAISFAERYDAHRLIEEFMVLANTCAAETLEARRTPFLYRVHEEPNPEKLDALREIAESVGLTLAKGQVLKTSVFNRLLDAAAGTENAELISLAVLRSMTQAYYAPRNFGHFGLNLRRYAHFTSPIRRYADLIVHRALVAAHKWGKDGLSPGDIDEMEATAEHISQTERRSMLAERDTTDRYVAAYLADRVGNEFEGVVSGIARFGLFIRLMETGADGLVPISHVGREYFHYDADAQTLTGEKSRRVIGLGMRATVRLAEAVPITGGLLLELLSIEGKALPRTAAGRNPPAPPRRAGRARRRRTRDQGKTGRTGR
ncbi:MAG: ribonuclease R [Paracoccaceae bacterium]